MKELVRSGELEADDVGDMLGALDLDKDDDEEEKEKVGTPEMNVQTPVVDIEVEEHKSNAKKKKGKGGKGKKGGKAGSAQPKANPLQCVACQEVLPSKNKLHQHLKETGHAAPIQRIK